MDLFNLLLTLHITGGAISLITGAVVILLKKGGKLHKIIGLIYFYSLLLASLVSFPMCFLHPNLFLFIIGVFTSYMLLTGIRYQKKTGSGSVNVYDWMLSTIMLFFGSGFIVLGAINLFNGINFGIVLLVFGSISLAFVLQDWRNYKGKSPIRNFGLTTHLQRMIGSYIAAATAFLVVNNTVLPSILAWLLPTVILSPLIFWWTKKYLVRI
ncbi:hypothetical protein ACXZ1K_04590 [Pedobacter sp. PWIIR3]